MDRLPIVTEMGELSMETYVLSIASYSLCSVMAVWKVDRSFRNFRYIGTMVVGYRDVEPMVCAKMPIEHVFACNEGLTYRLCIIMGR